MFARIKEDYKRLINAVPGRRFRDYYDYRKGHKKPWQRMVYISAGSVLIVLGFFLSLPPGIPGFLLWVPGLGLLVQQSKVLAILLDKAEVLVGKGKALWRKRSS